MAVKFTAEHSRTSEYRFLPEDITIMPDLNGRHDMPDIEWLITDILLRGQSTPVPIRNDGGLSVLVAGFSRWRAVREINLRRLLPEPLQLRCTYIQCTEAEAFLINISENRFRNPTTPIDDAHNIKRLLNIYGKTEEQICLIYFPTAKTDSELREARRFVAERIALIQLAPEAEAAVREGRVSAPAARAIAKLTTAEQKEVIKKEGKIERSDVVAPKAPKVAPKAAFSDAELMRRLNVLFDDIHGLLYEDLEYLEVDRPLLISLYEYVYPGGMKAV